MKIQTLDLHTPNPLRRRLLLGVPSGFMLATPLALVACGGSDDDASPDTAPTDDGPPGPLATSTSSVAIQIPDALAATAGALQIVTATGSAPVSGGTASIVLIGDGPQLVSVVGADGHARLLGWAGTGQPAVSLQSTAAVLLYFGLGVPFLGATAREALRERLRAQPAVATYGDAIGAALLADPKALAAANAGILDGFEQAAATLLPAQATAMAGRSRPLGLVVQPASDQSGLQVVQGETLNSFFVDNAYVRRAVVVVNREGYTPAGSTQEVPEPNAPVQVGEVMDLPLPTAVDSVAGVVGGWANEYYAPDDPNSFFRSVTEPVTLELAPSDAKRTRYNVVVLTAGALMPANAAEYARLPASQKAYVSGLDLGKNLVLQMLFEDLLAPLFFQFLSDRLGKADKTASAVQQADAALLGAFAAQMLSILQTRMPDLTQRLSEGRLDAWGAFKEVIKACTVNLDTGEVSPLLAEFLTQGAQLCAKALADAKMRSKVLEVATGLSLGNKNVLGFIPVLGILANFDKVLGKAALVRIVMDAGRSSRMVCWSVSATKAKVVLKPDPLEVPADAVTYKITAEIVDNDNDEYGNEKGSISFDWTCTGLYGTLYSPVDGALANPNTFTTSATNAKPNYIPNGTPFDPANPDKITVTAYFEPIGSGGTRTLIGSASAPLKFKQEFSLKLSPPGPTDLPTDLAFPVAAFFDQKIPDGASVEWTWTHTGVGSLAALPTDTNTHDYSATYNTGSSDGAATVTVSAKVSVPAGNGKPARVVNVDPVTAKYKVKKGTREITFDAPGGVFACGPTCGVTDYSAFIVPRVKGALGYRAVFSGFGYGPCNRGVSWTTEVGDGGGCNFPISYHPFAAREAASAWAVWIGFGGPITEGKCTVTITLPA